ncbi:MAG: glycosyltransferase family 2 protein [Chloroflexi bacterium]|nr:glycosyltransferase family 2 protein [Chloroflexota bacterium]
MSSPATATAVEPGRRSFLPGAVPDLSVAVVTHNGRELALATLRSALANAGPITVEWFVADAGSSDGTPGVIADALPEVSVLCCENEGFAHGNNVVLERARGRYVLLLNPDIEIERGTLAALVQALDERPEVGAASVIHRGTAGHLLPSMRRFPSPLRNLAEALGATRLPWLQGLQEHVCASDAYFGEHDADWVCGAFLIVRREAVRDVGPLDERFFLYSEEVDWCLRIRRAGWLIRHIPVMEITHHEGAASPARVAEECRSRMLYARKHFGLASALATRVALLLRHGLRAALFAPPALLRPQLRHRLRCETHALAVLIGAMQPPLSRAREERRAARSA